ncbi:hypothetical protein [Streptomyces sp. NRRL S-37]|nr:hypothetical protein [Streptomyces sp. NRRL S-37]
MRDYVLGLPGAAEEHPWGGTVAEAGRRVSVLPGADGGGHPWG